MAFGASAITDVVESIIGLLFQKPKRPEVPPQCENYIPVETKSQQLTKAICSKSPAEP